MVQTIDCFQHLNRFLFFGATHFFDELIIKLKERLAQLIAR